MSILRGLPFREITEFGGAWLLKDPPSVDFRGALRAQNIDWVAQQPGTRHGFGDTGLGSMALVDMAAWYGPFPQINSSYSGSVLLTVGYSGGNVIVKAINLGTGTGPTVSYASGTVPTTATLIGVGMNAYVALASAMQEGVDVGSVISLKSNSGSLAVANATMKNLFSPPSTYTATPTQGAAGNCTAGTHRLAYLIEYISGFTTRMSPDSGAVTPPDVTSFQPMTITLNTSAQIQLTLSNTWSGLFQNIAAISIAMTTTANLNQYYIVPGSRQTLSSDGVTPISRSWTINISDGDLASTSTDATPYLYWLTQTPSGVSPFNTRHMAIWGNRMAYLGTTKDNSGNLIDALYVSERNSYQAITADQHLVQLPGQRPMTTMFALGGSYYIIGPHEIWATSDTGDVPTTWPAPTLVDGKHGTLAIHGVELSPGNNFAWLADQSGLYVFDGGPINLLPVSFEQTPDWNRINWQVPSAIRIKDDATNKRVQVMVPLDGATSPSHVMTWDYTYGALFDAARYSLDSISGYSLGTMEVVRNDLAGQAQGNSGKLELWLGSSASAPILRRQTDADLHPYRDYGNANAIPSVYRTALFPGKGQQSGVLQHHGFHSRIVGSGSIAPKVYDLDGNRSFACAAKALSASPDVEMLWLADLRSELAAVEFNTTNSAQDTRFRVTSIKWYYSPWIVQR